MPSGLIAYSLSSNDPTYIVPSLPIAGEESTEEPVSKLHFSVPFGLIAYRLGSFSPTYIVPSLPIAGDEYTLDPML